MISLWELVTNRSSAGGGGTSRNRTEKIKAKNKKLDENRFKRIQNEKTAKQGGEQKQPSLDDGVHPSRRARIPGNKW